LDKPETLFAINGISTESSAMLGLIFTMMAWIVAFFVAMLVFVAMLGPIFKMMKWIVAFFVAMLLLKLIALMAMLLLYFVVALIVRVLG
jgi:hypothetical protein